MCGFSESADICIILDKNGNSFGQILRNSRKCVKNLSYRTFYLITKMPWFSAKQSLESFPGVFLTGEPNTNKKTATEHQFITLQVVAIDQLLRRKTRTFLERRV